jgi:hypothetical protein
MFSTVRPAVLVLALALPALPALAGSVSTRLSQFSFELIDADPDDGITPAVQFFMEKQQTRSAYASLYRLVGEDLGEGVDSTEVGGPSGWARSGIGSDSWYSEASSRIGPTDYEFYSSYATSKMTFTLTPGTTLQFRVLAEHTRADSPEMSLLVAPVSLEGHLYGADGWWLNGFDKERYAGTDGESFWLSGSLTSGAKAAAGWVEVAVSGYAYTHATAVPEPRSYAMLLAGLGLVGAVAARRRGHAPV